MASSLRWQGTLVANPGLESGATWRRGIVVFSGGSAANSLVDIFDSIAKQHASTLSYVIPISDNGGSTSELIRVLGGPGKWQIYYTAARG